MTTKSAEKKDMDELLEAALAVAPSKGGYSIEKLSGTIKTKDHIRRLDATALWRRNRRILYRKQNNIPNN